MRLVLGVELLQNSPTGGEFDVQQRGGFLFQRQQDKLTIAAIGVKVMVIVKLIADFRGITGNIDVKVGQLRLLPRQMLERAIIPLDERGGGDFDEIAEDEASGDEAFHGSSHDI